MCGDVTWGLSRAHANGRHFEGTTKLTLNEKKKKECRTNHFPSLTVLNQFYLNNTAAKKSKTMEKTKFFACQFFKILEWVNQTWKFPRKGAICTHCLGCTLHNSTMSELETIAGKLVFVIISLFIQMIHLVQGSHTAGAMSHLKIFNGFIANVSILLNVLYIYANVKEWKV